MYRTLAQSAGNVLGYHFSGKLTEAEVKEVYREIEAAVEKHGKVRLLVEMGDLSTPELQAAWEDLKRTPQWIKDLEKMALVGDDRWQRWATSLTDLISQGEAEFFRPDELDKAWYWVRE